MSHHHSSSSSSSSSRERSATAAEKAEEEEATVVNKITTTGTNVLFFILLTHVGDIRGKRVVEIGCGNGRGTELLSGAVGPNGTVLARCVRATPTKMHGFELMHACMTWPFSHRVFFMPCGFFLSFWGSGWRRCVLKYIFSHDNCVSFRCKPYGRICHGLRGDAMDQLNVMSA
jgi:hypothetical protein